MPTLSVPIHDTHGAVIELRIGKATPTGSRSDPGERVRVMLDTGAQRSSIDEEMARQLGLELIGNTEIVTPSTGDEAMPTRIYHAVLTLEHPDLHVRLPSTALVSAKIANQGVSLILGRDLLALFTIIWEGPERRCLVCA